MREASTVNAGIAGTSRIWADGKRVALSEAVAANSVAVHAHFQDDTEHNSWSHPGSLVVPVAVGLGDAADASLHTVLRAIVVGYASLEWLGGAEIVSLALIRRGMRTSPTFGTIAAAAAASAVMELDEVASTNAIAIAACITGAVVEPVRTGSDEWRLQNAHAARGGLIAAQLASRGVLGAPNALEGPRGFLSSLAGLSTAPEKWSEDPSVEIMHQIMAKPWATLGDNMSAVAAAKLLHDDGIPIDQIAKITVKIWRPYTEYPGTLFKGPFERTVQALASTAFATSVMLLFGKLTYEMSQDKRDDFQVMDLVYKTSITPDDEGGPLDAVVTIELRDGRALQRIARDSNSTLIFQDKPTAMRVLRERLAAREIRSSVADAVSNMVFRSTENGGPQSVRRLVDQLASWQ